MGRIKIEREGYWRKAYTRKDGVKIPRTWVKPSTFYIQDPGKPGRRSRGAEAGPFKDSPPWIRHEGKLGGPGYTKKSQTKRHKILDRCIKKHGYRSCLGSILVLMKNSQISPAIRTKLEVDKIYLMNKYGSGAKNNRKKNPRKLTKKYTYIRRLNPRLKKKNSPKRKSKKKYK